MVPAGFGANGIDQQQYQSLYSAFSRYDFERVRDIAAGIGDRELVAAAQKAIDAMATMRQAVARQKQMVRR